MYSDADLAGAAAAVLVCPAAVLLGRNVSVAPLFGSFW